jgi:hypothetical protein
VAGYKLFVLHIICVGGGFGGIVYRAFVSTWPAGAAMSCHAGILGCVRPDFLQVAEVLIYGDGRIRRGCRGRRRAPQLTSFARPWVGAALVMYVVMVGVLHGLVRPAERRYRAALLELAQIAGHGPAGPAPATGRDGRPLPAHRRGDGHLQRVFYWGLFT